LPAFVSNSPAALDILRRDLQQTIFREVAAGTSRDDIVRTIMGLYGDKIRVFAGGRHIQVQLPNGETYIFDTGAAK
jgi:hypothetical protein